MSVLQTDSYLDDRYYRLENEMNFDDLIKNHPIKLIADDDPRYDARLAERMASGIEIGQKRNNLSTPCLDWTKYKDRDGYGQIKVNGVNEQAHRVAWELASRIELPSDVFVCHHCDNPACIDPTHMFPGTSTENNHDMIKKGRAVPPPVNKKKKIK